MDSRQQFEEWAISSAWLGLGEESQLHMDADGKGYNEIEVHTAWLAWQASRESLVVELPEPIELETVGVGCTMSDEYFDIDDVKLAINDAGIKYK